MNDRILINLAPGWALGFDLVQWILGKVVKTGPGAEKTTAGARLRGVAFITATKAALRRVIQENEIKLSPEPAEYIDGMPETFRAWHRQHIRRFAPVPDSEAA